MDRLFSWLQIICSLCEIIFRPAMFMRIIIIFSITSHSGFVRVSFLIPRKRDVIVHGRVPFKEERIFVVGCGSHVLLRWDI
jgi:hypothetical protein